MASVTQVPEQSKVSAPGATATTAVDKARARTAASQAARVPEELLRALGARGRFPDTMDPASRRAYGLSLLVAVEEVAAEAQRCGRNSHGEYVGGGEGERGRRRKRPEDVRTSRRFCRVLCAGGGGGASSTSMIHTVGCAAALQQLSIAPASLR